MGDRQRPLPVAVVVTVAMTITVAPGRRLGLVFGFFGGVGFCRLGSRRGGRRFGLPRFGRVRVFPAPGVAEAVPPAEVVAVIVLATCVRDEG
jgi:hypothetical protein